MPLPHQYIWWTEKTARDWADRSDRYLDPLTVPATRDSLKFSMDKAEDMGRATQLSESVKASLESELDMSDSRNCLFREMAFYFDAQSESRETENVLAKRQVKFCGGLVTENLVNNVSHVVVSDIDNPTEHIRAARKRRLEEGRKIFRTVTTSWINESVSGSKMITH